MIFSVLWLSQVNLTLLSQFFIFPMWPFKVRFIIHHKLFRVCINSTEDYHYQLLMKAQSGSNLESLWGSIALGISIFGILIVIISGFYFIFTVNRKQKTEYGRLVVGECYTIYASLNVSLEIELFSLFVNPLFLTFGRCYIAALSLRH